MSKIEVDWLILKIAQRCNINCSYCYVYNRGDSSWSDRPPVLHGRVLEAICGRISSHTETASIETLHVELHGGEPLLVGKRRFRSICESVVAASKVPVTFHLQTNGLLLDQGWIDLFVEFRIGFGLSLDGPPSLNDRNRIDHFGCGTGQRVIDRIRETSTHPMFSALFGGVLCVLSSPLPHGGALVEWFVSNGIERFDFLMPDGNWVNFPADWSGAAEYSVFWMQVYDAWSARGGDAPRIRTIENFVSALAGETPHIDALGGDLRSMLVIESDGSYGVSDVGRICPPLNVDIHNVFENEFSDHSARQDILQYQELCAECKQCSFLKPCGGGYLPHRYNGVNFDAPSIYCDVWKAMSKRAYSDLKGELRAVI